MQNVLVINDEFSDRDYLGDLLTSFGFQALWASNAAGAGALLRREACCAIIFDDASDVAQHNLAEWQREHKRLIIIELFDPENGPAATNTLKIAKPISALQLRGMLKRVAAETIFQTGIQGSSKISDKKTVWTDLSNKTNPSDFE